jgi:hypothetical protein
MTHHPKKKKSKKKQRPSAWRQSPKRRRPLKPRWQDAVGPAALVILAVKFPVLIPLLLVFAHQQRP